MCTLIIVVSHISMKWGGYFQSHCAREYRVAEYMNKIILVCPSLSPAGVWVLWGQATALWVSFGYVKEDIAWWQCGHCYCTVCIIDACICCGDSLCAGVFAFTCKNIATFSNIYKIISSHFIIYTIICTLCMVVSSLWAVKKHEFLSYPEIGYI